MVFTSMKAVRQALTVGDSTFMSREEAEAVVASTIKEYSTSCSEEELQYLHGHAKRFVLTLMRIPPARNQGEPCLDVGGFALTPYWLTKYFGYQVHVLNWNAKQATGQIFERNITVGTTSVSYTESNIDLNEPWPTDKQYAFILFCETLEHLIDPIRAMGELNSVCKKKGRVLLSTPNANSFYALAEFFKGLPAWVFRYFEPDAGGTRHIFEQTPYTMAELALAGGFSVKGFSTACVYGPDTSEQNVVIAEALDLDPSIHGEVMFMMLQKKHQGIIEARPPCLYNAEEFYTTLHNEFVTLYYDKTAYMRAKPQVLVDKISTLVGEVNSLSTANNDLSMELDEEHTKNIESTVHHGLALDRLSSELVLLREEYARLKEDHARNIAYIGQYVIGLDRLFSELVPLRGEHAQLKEDHARNVAYIGQYGIVLDQLSSELVSLREDHARNIAYIGQYVIALDQLSSELVPLREEHSRLKEDHTRNVAYIGQCVMAMDKLAAELTPVGEQYTGNIELSERLIAELRQFKKEQVRNIEHTGQYVMALDKLATELIPLREQYAEAMAKIVRWRVSRNKWLVIRPSLLKKRLERKINSTPILCKIFVILRGISRKIKENFQKFRKEIIKRPWLNNRLKKIKKIFLRLADLLFTILQGVWCAIQKSFQNLKKAIIKRPWLNNRLKKIKKLFV